MLIDYCQTFAFCLDLYQSLWFRHNLPQKHNQMSPYPVQLYVYDLSKGLARMLSQQLIQRQIDGIWHTSVVVFNREIFFGQGVMESAPGQSHHGTPVEIVEMGPTEITPELFDEFLTSLKETWTAEKYHLLDNNCNSFSDVVTNFLVGKNIPEHITGLPAEFLNTPFGHALRPMIEGMFGPSSIPIANAIPSPKIESIAPIPLPQLIQFQSASSLDAIFGKLTEFANLTPSLMNEESVLIELKVWMRKSALNEDFPPHFGTTLRTVSQNLPDPQRFPFLDIIRLLSLRGSFIRVYTLDALFDLIHSDYEARKHAKSNTLPAPSLANLLMIQRLAANLFSHPELQSRFVQEEKYRDIMTEIAVDGVLSDQKGIVDASCAHLLNASLMLPALDAHVPRDGSSIAEWCCQIVAASVTSLSQGTFDSSTTCLRLLQCLQVIGACHDPSVRELSELLEIGAVLSRIKTRFQQQEAVVQLNQALCSIYK